jgi:hypothetical protein
LLESVDMSIARRAAGLSFAFLVAGLSQASAQAPATSNAGGVQWKVPAGWTEERGSAMRVATYKIAGPKGTGASADTSAECAVFFFGPGQGGSVDANLERWSRQFEGTPKPERSERRVNGLPVTVARLAGTYLAPGGPMMQSQGKRPGYRLLGAIVEAPSGLVFFKLTGPAATIAATERSFEALLASLSRGTPGRT